MATSGFLEQKRASPGGFVLVLAGHAAVLAAVILVKGPEIIPAVFPRTKIEMIELPQVPPEAPPPDRPTPLPPLQIFAPTPPLPLPPRPEIGIDTGRVPIGPIADPVPPTPLPPHVDPAPPLRTDASVDPRFAAALQPQYPASEQRAQNSGTVRIRVTIGTDGRVRAVERVSASSDAFWAAAERQALTRWRFRPATVDGRPVESTKMMTIHFRIGEA